MTDTNGNGNGLPELPADHAALAEASGKAFANQYHTVAAHRDALVTELAKVKSDLTLAMVGYEAMKAQINDLKEYTASTIANMESRMAAMTATRDEAVAYRAKAETFISQLDAQFRAYKPPAVPLIRDIPTDNDSGIG